MDPPTEIIEDIIISPAGDAIETSFEPPVMIDGRNERDGRKENGRETDDRKEYVRKAVRAKAPRIVSMPPGLESPLANYYAKIKWEDGFEQWRLVRFSTPGDGSCMFHAITNSFFKPYHTGILDGKSVSRNKIIASFRKELSDRLDTKVSDAPDSPTYYDLLNRGYTAEWAKDAKVAEYTLTHMQQELDSNTYIGYGYIELIGNALNKDIYVLEASRQDIYRQVDEDLELIIKGNRNSIILYNIDNSHYELVGLRNSDGSFDTHFSPTHSLIQFLYGRVQNIIRSVRSR